jgi:hypothetical protein
MKWSREHVLTWGYMGDFMLTVDLDRQLLSSHRGTIDTKHNTPGHMLLSNSNLKIIVMLLAKMSTYNFEDISSHAPWHK